MLDQNRKELHEQFSQILSTIRESKTPKFEAPTFSITTRSGVSTQDPPFPASPRPTSDNVTEGEIKKRPEGEEPSIIQEPVPRPSIFYQPSKSSNLPFLSRLKKQKKDDEDERLLLIFKQIHINLPFLEAMIHMPKGARVLKDLLLHKEKLEKVASSVKLSEECSAIIQRNLPQKEGDPGSFTLPCLIGPVAVKNVLADLGGDSNEVLAVSFYPRTEPVEPLEWKALENRLNRSRVEPPKLELKELPEHLEYAFLQENNQLQRSSHPHYPPLKKPGSLRFFKIIKGRSPEVILKKGGMTVVKNEKGKLISQQMVTGWRVCIDYHKLNNAARKDHFPLQFIDQMLERLVGQEYYCFLDGFSGYFQIPITPEDQDKTTFTCPYGTFAYK
ncbi:hypothetical protein Tco_0167509 [Tanacetum coccineum]